MLYFSEVPVELKSIDIKQYEKLIKFKKECQQRGLIETYSDRTKFGEKFRIHLTKKIYQDSYFNKEAIPTNIKETKFIFDPDIQTTQPKLSEHAKTLLIEASKDPSGTVLKISFVGESLVLETNKTNLAKKGDARAKAAWEAAVIELCNHGFLQERGYKGEVFSITHTGYLMADYLSSQ